MSGLTIFMLMHRPHALKVATIVMLIIIFALLSVAKLYDKGLIGVQ